MKCAAHRSALRIQEILGSDYEVQEFELPTRTVAEAAAAIGCEEAQIAKSLVFRSGSDRPVLVVACGTNRVDTTKVAVIVGEKITRADPDFVRERVRLRHRWCRSLGSPVASSNRVGSGSGSF